MWRFLYGLVNSTFSTLYWKLPFEFQHLCIYTFWYYLWIKKLFEACFREEKKPTKKLCDWQTLAWEPYIHIPRPIFFVSATIIHIKNAILFKFFHLDFSPEILRPKLISIPYISLFNSIHFLIKIQKKKELKIFGWKKNIRRIEKKWRSQWIKLRKASVFFPLENGFFLSVHAWKRYATWNEICNRP